MRSAPQSSAKPNIEQPYTRSDGDSYRRGYGVWEYLAIPVHGATCANQLGERLSKYGLEGVAHQSQSAKQQNTSQSLDGCLMFRMAVRQIRNGCPEY
jgi:hypothetical protein